MEEIAENSVPENTTMQAAASVPITIETEQPFNWQLSLAIIYIIGVVVVLSRMLLSLWRLHRMTAESEIHPLAGHSLNLSFSNFTPKFNINLALRYGFTRNSIEQVTKLMPDTQIPGLKNPTGKDVLYSTYENIGHSEGINLNAYVNWNATKNTRIYANSRLSYTDMDDGAALHNYGWSLFAYGGAQQTLPKDWRLSLNFYASTPRVSLQGKGSNYGSYGVSIQKSWLKKRLNLTLSASDFLKKYITYNSTMEDNFFRADSWSKYVQQRFSLSISYRIGELKASVKKAERSISNDDVKGGGNSGGSSGNSE